MSGIGTGRGTRSSARLPLRTMLIGAVKPGAGPPTIPVRFRVRVRVRYSKKRFLSPH